MVKKEVCFNFDSIPYNPNKKSIKILRFGKATYSWEYVVFPNRTVYSDFYASFSRLGNKKTIEEEKALIKQFMSLLGVHPDFNRFSTPPIQYILKKIKNKFFFFDSKPFYAGGIVAVDIIIQSGEKLFREPLINSLLEIITESSKFGLVQFIFKPISGKKDNLNYKKTSSGDISEHGFFFNFSPRVLIVEKKSSLLENTLNQLKIVFKSYNLVPIIYPRFLTSVNSLRNMIMFKKLNKGLIIEENNLISLIHPPTQLYAQYGYKLVPNKSQYTLSLISSHNISDSNSISIGVPIISGKTTTQQLFIQGNDLNRHIAIFGMTGEGKSRLAYNLLKEFYLKGTKFLVFDPKGEYKQPLETFCSNFKYFCPGSLNHPMGKNLFQVPLNQEGNEIISSDEYSFLVNNIFEKVISRTDPKNFTPQMRRTMRLAINHTIKKNGTYKEFIEVLQNPSVIGSKGSYIDQTAFAIINRIERLFEGSNGRCFNVKEDNFLFPELLEGNVVIDLSKFEAMDDEFSRQIFLDVLLNILFYYIRKNRKPFKGRKLPKNVILIDEVQKMIPLQSNSTFSAQPTVLGQAPWTLRAYDVSLIFIGTDPVVARPIITNTAIQIFFYSRYNPTQIASMLGISVKEYENIKKLLKAKNDDRRCLVSINGKLSLIKVNDFYL